MTATKKAGTTNGAGLPSSKGLDMKKITMWRGKPIEEVGDVASDPNDRFRRLMEDNVSIESAYEQMMRWRNKDGAPQVVVEALAFSLRERGPAALSEPQTQRRLAEISEKQMHEVCGRLKWSTGDIEHLVERWTKDHG